MSDSVVNFPARKAKTPAGVALEKGEQLDFDACLAKHGLDRARVDALFAEKVTNEKEQAPHVAHRRAMLELQQQRIIMLQQDMVVLRERMDQLQADITDAIEMERDLGDDIVMEKLSYLQDIALGVADGNGPTGKPKRKRSRR